MSFDPAKFAERTYTEANDTKRTPIPAGEYIALIEATKISTWTKKDDPTKSGLRLDVTWSIDDAGVKALLGRDKVTTIQGIMLDLTEDGEDLDMGKGRNVDLGKLREATGLNNPGQAFAFSQFPGRLAKIMISHRVDGDTIRADVKSVTKV